MADMEYRTFRNEDIEWTGDGVYVVMVRGDYGVWVRVGRNDFEVIEQVLQQGRGIAYLEEAFLDDDEIEE